MGRRFQKNNRRFIWRREEGKKEKEGIKQLDVLDMEMSLKGQSFGGKWLKW